MAARKMMWEPVYFNPCFMRGVFCVCARIFRASGIPGQATNAFKRIP
jgi:hypothetical protein